MIFPFFCSPLSPMFMKFQHQNIGRGMASAEVPGWRQLPSGSDAFRDLTAPKDLEVSRISPWWRWRLEKCWSETDLSYFHYYSLLFIGTFGWNFYRSFFTCGRWVVRRSKMFEDGLLTCETSPATGFTEEIARDKLGIQGIEAEVLKILASISGCCATWMLWNAVEISLENPWYPWYPIVSQPSLPERPGDVPLCPGLQQSWWLGATYHLHLSDALRGIFVRHVCTMLYYL